MSVTRDIVGSEAAVERRYTLRVTLELGSPGAKMGEVHYDAMRTSRVDDVLVPDDLVILLPGGPDQPSLRIEADLDGGVMKCSSVELVAKPGRRGVSSEDLRMVKVDTLIDAVVKATSTEVVDRDDGGSMTAWTGDGLSTAGRRTVEQVMPKRGRQAYGAEHYRDVAKEYLRNRRVQDVEEAFDTSFSTAARWVREARKRGMVEDEGGSQ